jgi:hypothetical protein
MEFSSRCAFAEWPNRDIPAVAAGIYAIWRDDELFYCGMSGVNIEGARRAGKKKYGMVTRLNSHASGRLSGDQFCVHVANRCVIPNLSPDDLPRFANGEQTLDALTREFIHAHLDYQYVLVETSAEAFATEIQARRGEIFGVQPTLNPC